MALLNPHIQLVVNDNDWLQEAKDEKAKIDFEEIISTLRKANNITFHIALTWFFKSKGHYASTYNGYDWNFGRMFDTLIHIGLAHEDANDVMKTFLILEKDRKRKENYLDELI